MPSHAMHALICDMSNSAVSVFTLEVLRRCVASLKKERDIGVEC
jgi:hypothetical protein